MAEGQKHEEKRISESRLSQMEAHADAGGTFQTGIVQELIQHARAESGLVKDLAEALERSSRLLQLFVDDAAAEDTVLERECLANARDILAKAQTAPTEPQGGLVKESFQDRVWSWMGACFGPAISADTVERNHRFLEEALELVQACGCSREDCLKLVDYVYVRPVGEPSQEVGGVMVTLAALCLANALDMHQAAEVELARVWTKIEVIRAKQAAKPRGSALPISPSYQNEPAAGPV